MPDWIVLLPRMIQFTCCAILFGCPLFSLYGVRAAGPGVQRLVWLALGGMTLSVALAIAVQASILVGSTISTLRLDDLSWYLRETQIGRISSLRLIGVFVYASLLAFTAPSTRRTVVQAILGSALLGSFAWTGHGAEGGLAHLVSDLVHLLMAGVWVGALFAFILLIVHAQRNPEFIPAAADGLDAFSRIGVAVVALLVVGGIGNALFMFGLTNASELYKSEYGRALLLKLVLFGAMLGLAAANRYRLSPLLRQSLHTGDSREGLRLLRVSLISETSIALAVLGLAAYLGSIEPPNP